MRVGAPATSASFDDERRRLELHLRQHRGLRQLDLEPHPRLLSVAGRPGLDTERVRGRRGVVAGGHLPAGIRDQVFRQGRLELGARPQPVLVRRWRARTRATSAGEMSDARLPKALRT